MNQPPVNQIQNNESISQSVSQPKKKSNLTLIILLITIPLVTFVILIGLFAAMTTASISSARNKAKDAQLKSLLSSSRSRAELYFDEQNTYQGFSIDQATQNRLKEMNTEAIFIAKGKNSYILFAKMNSGKFWCLDPTITGKEISNLPSTNKCQ